jgi:starch-binding outer membrane protein, SusD/RagB family
MKIMKKILLFIIIVLSVLGCKKDFVERLPTTSNIVENFYRTPNDALQAITAIYNMNLQDDFWSSIIISEIASDNCAGGAGSTDGGGYQLYDRCLQQPDAGGNASQYIWKTYYGGIYRANVYIQSEKNINWTGKESLRSQYMAEARFLRAYFHFYLTRVYGEIPFLDHPLAPNEAIPGRTPAEDLYGKIIADLKYSATNCLSDPYGAMKLDNWGHATKWAAEAMLARVYLFYSGYYNKPDIKGFTAVDARNAIDTVIHFSQHKMVDSFASLWKVPAASQNIPYIGEINSEVVWSIRYSAGGGLNTFQRMVGPRNINTDPYGQGWGACPALPSLWNAYDPLDLRRKATILDWAGEGKIYPYVNNTQAQYTGYNIKKYETLSVGNRPVPSAWQVNNDEDFMVIRYADVLLMGAELYITTGGDNGVALGYVNDVRKRAFGNTLHNYTTITVDDILKERRFELVYEDSRYWDILRSCKGDFTKLVDILTNHDPNDEANFATDANSAETTYTNVDGNNFVAKKGLFQLPQSELDLMKGVIKQNPGYN